MPKKGGPALLCAPGGDLLARSVFEWSVALGRPGRGDREGDASGCLQGAQRAFLNSPNLFKNNFLQMKP